MSTLFTSLLAEEPAVEKSASSLSMEDLFEEIPVSLEVFIRDKRYLGETQFNPSVIQSDAIKHIERVYFSDMYPRLAEYNPYWAANLPMTNYHTLQWGKGSGKDAVCRLSSLRVAYLLLCMKSPQFYYRMPADDSIHLLNVAMSAKQATDAFFDPLKRMVRRGWFKDKCDDTADTITYDKNIICKSGHSEAESQEGLNLLLGICDEIDGFKTKEQLNRFRGSNSRDSTKSAEAIMDMMETSAVTRFPEVFKQVYISYPRYKGSMIQKLTKKAKEDIEEDGKSSPHFVSGPYATWEVHPNKKKEQFKNQFKKDPILAAAKFECNPTYAADPYFKNDLAIEKCMVEYDIPPVSVEYRNDGKAWTPVYTFSDDFYPVQGAMYSMHSDMAISNDRAGIALSHVQRYEEEERLVTDEDGTQIKRVDRFPRVKVDFVIAYEADVTAIPAREIQIRWARDLCFELIRRGFNIRQASYDGFQSTESRQDIESKGILSPLISTDRSEEPWRTLRDLFYSEVGNISRITVPRDQRLFEELLGLTKGPNGKVDHQPGGSKDMADGLACSVSGAVALGGQEAADGARAYYAPPEFHSFEPLVELPDGFSLEKLTWDACVVDDMDIHTSLSSWLDQ